MNATFAGNDYLLNIPWTSQSLVGCPDRQLLAGGEAAYWEDRACGVASVLMCIRFFLPETQTTLTRLVVEGRDAAFYSDRGWTHRGLANLLERNGLAAEPRRVERSHSALRSILDEDQLIIGSVTLGFPDDGRQGGHLVVINGHRLTASGVAVHVRDPDQKSTQVGWLEWERFSPSFSGRVVVCGRRSIWGQSRAE